MAKGQKYLGILLWAKDAFTKNVANGLRMGTGMPWRIFQSLRVSPKICPGLKLLIQKMIQLTRWKNLPGYVWRLCVILEYRHENEDAKVHPFQVMLPSCLHCTEGERISCWGCWCCASWRSHSLGRRKKLVDPKILEQANRALVSSASAWASWAACHTALVMNCPEWAWYKSVSGITGAIGSSFTSETPQLADVQKVFATSCFERDLQAYQFSPHYEYVHIHLGSYLRGGWNESQ